MEKYIQEVLAKLADHETRIVLLENPTGENASKAISTPSKSKRVAKGKGEDLLPPIQRLVQDNFFEKPKIDLDVMSELQKRLLTRKKPLRASVVNVLRKLVRDEILERTEITKDKKSLIAYINS